MKRESSSEPVASRMLEILAVLGQARVKWLSGISGNKISPYLMKTLEKTPGIHKTEDWLVFEPGAAAVLLASLEERDLPRFRALHEGATAYLAECLKAGEPGAEPSFLAVFERLSNRLLLDDPPGFVRLVERAANLPMSSSGGRQKLAYFQGLALVKSDRFAEAIPVFDQLLTDAGAAS